MIIKKILLLLAIGIFPIACSYEKNSLKEVLLNDKDWYTGGIFFPVKITSWEEHEKDTVCIVTTSYSLWLDLNIRDIGGDNFPRLLYDKLQETDGCLDVNKELFFELQKYKIERSSEVDSIYKHGGINGILSYYVKPTGDLFNTPKVVDYIIYLCYQHGIYFRILDTEEGTMIFTDNRE